MPVRFEGNIPEGSASSHHNSNAGAETGPLCMKCHQKAISYKTDTCEHGLFCVDCAMKCATGGKCKICNAFYGSFQRI